MEEIKKNSLSYQKRKKELEGEINERENQIEILKQEALEKEYYEKLFLIADILGEIYWSNGDPYYHNEGLKIQIDGSTVQVQIENPIEKVVFYASYYSKDNTSISTYLKGEWEQKIERVYKKAQQEAKEGEIKRLKNELYHLDNNFGSVQEVIKRIENESAKKVMEDEKE